MFFLVAITLLLFLQTSITKAGPTDIIPEDTKILIKHFEGAMEFIINEDYFLGQDEWKLRNVYSSILKEIGKEQDIETHYKGFARSQNLKAFQSDLPNYLKSYLENKPNKALFMRRLTKLLLQQDPYAQFFSEQDFKKSLKGQPYSDDGLIIGSQNHRLIIIAVYPDSSADKAGLKPLDIIVAINDVGVMSKENESDEELEERAWTVLVAHKDAVKYTIMRSGTSLNFNTEFKKKESEEKTGINPKEISWIADNDIGVIVIKTFYSHTIKEQFLKAYKYLTEEKQVKGLIIDLKDNTGGYLFEAIAIASFFTTDEHILVINKRNGRQFIKTYPLPGITKFKGPVVVLVNSLTASAAEMFTASLRQHGHLIIGSKTYGKNIAQILRILEDGSVILISSLSTAIPDGPDRMVSWAQGITPDYEVTFSEGKMNAMSFAKEKLRELLPHTQTEKYIPSPLLNFLPKETPMFVEYLFMKKIYDMTQQHI